MTAMPIPQTDLRRALKRGRAREALAHAGLQDTDLAALFRFEAKLRPERRGLDRPFQEAVMASECRGPGTVLISNSARHGLQMCGRYAPSELSRIAVM